MKDQVLLIHEETKSSPRTLRVEAKKDEKGLYLQMNLSHPTDYKSAIGAAFDIKDAKKLRDFLVEFCEGGRG